MQTNTTPAVEALVALRSPDTCNHCDAIEAVITALVTEGDEAVAASAAKDTALQTALQNSANADARIAENSAGAQTLISSLNAQILALTTPPPSA